ncbi:unnamed protein product [Mesocestoides corti]|uniref:Peptidase M16 C-terminal domain-containing protein n=1 Tax=Mesocestoides corti TaxID=53468 RepID=A0A0R3UNI6_MESCO|nr:unnamed protein product [Mesocestoides corti]
MGVYVDARFFPNKKTGDWNPRTLKSNLLTLLHQVVENNLLPVSQGHISDGHPHAIPFLSWEALKEFHSNFYHPRNAIIYAYGNLDVDNYFQHLDSDCLGKFTVQDPPPKVVFEPNNQVTTITIIAVLSSSDPSADATLKVFADSLDFALTNDFTEQELLEAKLSVFKEVGNLCR